MNAPRLAVTSPTFLLAMRLTCRCVSDSTAATPAASASRLLLIISCTLLCTLLINSCAGSPLVLGPGLLAAMFAVLRLPSWLYPPAGVNGSRYRGDQPGDRRPTSARAPRISTRETAAVYLYNCCNCFCSPVLAVLCFILNIWDVKARRAGSSLGQLGMTMVARQSAGRGTCLLVLVLLAGGANGSPIDPVPDDGSSDLRWLAVAESLALLIGAEGLPLVARRVQRFLSQLRGHEGVLPSATAGCDMAAHFVPSDTAGLDVAEGVADLASVAAPAAQIASSASRVEWLEQHSPSYRPYPARTPPTRRTSPTHLRLQQRRLLLWLLLQQRRWPRLGSRAALLLRAALRLQRRLLLRLQQQQRWRPRRSRAALLPGAALQVQRRSPRQS